MSNLNFILYGVYPYIAFIVLLVGSWIRFDTNQYSWKASSSQLLRGNMRMASVLMHLGVLLILGGHFVGLLTPESIYHHVISSQAKQLVAMTIGGLAGVMMLVGLLMLIYRRLTDERVRANSRFSDVLVLFLLLIQLLLGLSSIVVSTHHLDGSVMVLLATWAQKTVTWQPMEAAEAISSVHIIYKLHVFFGLTLLLVFPFTRLVHILSVPIWYFGRNYQIVRRKQQYR
ncbi:respiratory nitrate reductase subunit gamma [Reinekea sp. G2M2-21]|uniref:respiratory nitrate reductase subunit gamma n=1 Tax=Reinekea sp. G2M2-21 TaxID=2788942 RepID=UPI0018A9AED6|nr:respiratory nitrate reductase subunit gamma [Reinekea sp. G2M2-21]